jgi:hypothetical protein
VQGIFRRPSLRSPGRLDSARDAPLRGALPPLLRRARTVMRTGWGGDRPRISSRFGFVVILWLPRSACGGFFWNVPSAFRPMPSPTELHSRDHVSFRILDLAWLHGTPAPAQTHPPYARHVMSENILAAGQMHCHGPRAPEFRCFAVFRAFRRMGVCVMISASISVKLLYERCE